MERKSGDRATCHGSARHASPSPSASIRGAVGCMAAEERLTAHNRGKLKLYDRRVRRRVRLRVHARNWARHGDARRVGSLHWACHRRGGQGRDWVYDRGLDDRSGGVVTRRLGGSAPISISRRRTRAQQRAFSREKSAVSGAPNWGSHLRSSLGDSHAVTLQAHSSKLAAHISMLGSGSTSRSLLRLENSVRVSER